jgi:hypothetical protein
VVAFVSANGPSVATGAPFVKLTVFAVLPSRALLEDQFTGRREVLAICVMNSIISLIHSGDLVSIIVAASPNIMIMYFISSLPWSRPGRALAQPGRSGRPLLDSVEEIPADLFPSMRRTFGQVYLTWRSLVPPQRT